MTGGISFRDSFNEQVLGNQYRRFLMVEEEEVVVPWEDVSKSIKGEGRMGLILLVVYSLPSFFGNQFQRPQ